MGVGWALGCTSLEDITKVGPGSQHCLKKTFVLTSAKFEVFNPFAIYYTYIYMYYLQLWLRRGVSEKIILFEMHG